MLTYAKVITPRAVTLMFSDGRSFSRPVEDPMYHKVVPAILTGASAEELLDMLDTVNQLATSLNKVGNVEVTRDGVMYKDTVVHMTVTDRILEFQREGHDVTFMLTFLDNLFQNPYRDSVLSMYEFLEHNKVPITKDGCFFAYKKVNDDYKDYYSGTFDNSIGQKPTVEGWQVDPDRNHCCSKGLHVCAPQYLPHYHGDQGHVMICKVNPKDVYAVPRDYNQSKMRCTTYEVVGELTDEQKAAIFFRDNPTLNRGDDVPGVDWGQEEDDRAEPEEFCVECGTLGVNSDDCGCTSPYDPFDADYDPGY